MVLAPKLVVTAQNLNFWLQTLNFRPLVVSPVSIITHVKCSWLKLGLFRRFCWETVEFGFSATADVRTAEPPPPHKTTIKRRKTVEKSDFGAKATVTALKIQIFEFKINHLLALLKFNIK